MDPDLDPAVMIWRHNLARVSSGLQSTILHHYLLGEPGVDPLDVPAEARALIAKAALKQSAQLLASICRSLPDSITLQKYHKELGGPERFDPDA